MCNKYLKGLLSECILHVCGSGDMQVTLLLSGKHCVINSSVIPYTYTCREFLPPCSNPILIGSCNSG